jgi:integrase
MKQQRKKIKRHLYEMSWQNSSSDWSKYYYAVFRCRLKGKDRRISLGSDLKVAKDLLVEIEARNVRKEDFDLDRQRAIAKPKDGKASPFTFSEWCEKYSTFDDVKRKRSLTDELNVIRLHLSPFFNVCPLTEITRESLNRYIDHRGEQTIIRNKQGGSKKKVSRGTISNELSLLRRMLRTALREGYKVSVPSFEDLIVRSERGGHEISEDEQAKLLPVFEPWMQRLWEFGRETCLSQGDLLRLTDSMIDERQGTIKPLGGRMKTKVEQVSPLTPRAREVYEQIKADKKAGSIVPNLSGLVFTLNDGTRINKGHIHAQVKKALKQTGVKKFVFHNLRNTALTEWARQGIPVDVAMKASGHSSVQMHQRYVDLQAADVANAFGTSQIDKRIDKRKRGSSAK